MRVAPHGTGQLPVRDALTQNLTRLLWQLNLANNVIRWGVVFRNVWLCANDVYQLVSSPSATRVIVSFENHNLEFQAVPTLMNDNNRLIVMVLSGRNRVTATCALGDNASNGLYAKLLASST